MQWCRAVNVRCQHMQPQQPVKSVQAPWLVPRLQLLGSGKGRRQGAVPQAVQQGIRGRQLLQVPVCRRGH